MDIVEILKRANVELRSLAEPWADTTSPSGKMVLTVFAGIAEFERSLIADRTQAGRSVAKKRGVRFGRPKKLSPEQIEVGKRLISEGTSFREVSKLFGSHPATVYRAISASIADDHKLEVNNLR